MPQLVAGRVAQPGPAARGGRDLIGALGRQRLPAARALEHHEDPISAGISRPFSVQVGSDRREEPARHRDQPLPATADLNDEDETGYVWTFLDEARDPGQIRPGALVVAGDEEAAAVCQVVDLVPAGDGMIVHLRLLPGLVDEYRALVERALAS